MNEVWAFLTSLVAELARLPFLLLFLFTLALAAIAWRRRAYPSLALVLLAGLPLVCSLGLLGSDQALVVLAAVDVAVLAIAIVDLVLLTPSETNFEVERDVGRIASLKKNHRVELTVSNLAGGGTPQITIRDGVPQEFTATPAEFTIPLEGQSRAVMHYELVASRRGAFSFDEVFIRVSSWLGLWQAIYSYEVKSEVNVYPDMKQIAEYAILARTNRLSLMGVRRTRKIGTDNEFERLRDYSLDDNYKHLDWRATARRGKLTVKDFQTSQSQRLIFLIDAGRMMTNEAGGISLLDHALNAMLMLSYVALRQGDSVGAICFNDSVRAFVPPRGGANQMNRLLHASYDLFPDLVESRYDQAFLYLSRHCRKRSLVILITNVIDEVNAHQVQQYLGTLVGKHLPLGLLLRDHRLFDAANVPTPSGPDLYRAAAAASILTWRQQVLNDLIHHGVLALDAFPEQMTAPLVNSYLEIKARHLL